MKGLLKKWWVWAGLIVLVVAAIAFFGHHSHWTA